MLEQKFYSICDKILSNLAQEIENLDSDSKLDIEYLDGILKITIEQNLKTFVINRHSASQKIWYSSPFSGANYFVFDEEKQKWFDDNKNELSKTILTEIKNIL
jgi:iron donor protein CyaY